MFRCGQFFAGLLFDSSLGQGATYEMTWYTWWIVNYTVYVFFFKITIEGWDWLTVAVSFEAALISTMLDAVEAQLFLGEPHSGSCCWDPGPTFCDLNGPIFHIMRLLPSWKRTYLIARHFWVDDFLFLQDMWSFPGGYVFGCIFGCVPSQKSDFFNL